MYGFYHGQDEMALSVPVVSNNFLKEVFPTSRILSVTALAVYGSLILPFIFFSFYIVSWDIEILKNETGILTNTTASLGLFLFSLSVLQLILFNLPLPMTKNHFGIRWGFLFGLHAPQHHARLDAWIAEEQNKKGIGSGS
jgi:hypothetical protein